MFRRRPDNLIALGDTSSTMVQIDSSDVLGLGDQLREAQARLTNLLGQMRQDPELARAIGRDVTAQQAALGDLTAKYVGVYYSIFGQNPVGLGAAQLLVAAVVVGIVVYIAANIRAWFKKQEVLEQQAQAQILAEQNRASLIDMAQQKQDDAAKKAAAGDTAGAAADQDAANAILQNAGIPGTGAQPGTQTFSDWIKANWITVAAIGGAIFLVPRLIDR